MVNKVAQGYAQQIANGLNLKFEDGYKGGPLFGSYDVATTGSKYVRVVKTDDFGVQRSVECFVDDEGNVYKAASWKGPDKGIVRYNVATDEGLERLLNAADPFGGYLYADRCANASEMAEDAAKAAKREAGTTLGDALTANAQEQQREAALAWGIAAMNAGD